MYINIKNATTIKYKLNLPSAIFLVNITRNTFSHTFSFALALDT